MPAIGLSIVVILCGYLALKAYKELKDESASKFAMYEATGISEDYDCKLPVDEKVCMPCFHSIIYPFSLRSIR